MSTSGSVNYSLQRDQIIREAYELLGIYSASDTMEDEDLQSGARTLNLMIKSWQSDGVYLWKETEGTIFLDYHTRQYTLGPNGAHGSDTFVQTTLGADLTVSATSVTVASTTGMTAGDHIGIQTSLGPLFWTTIVSVDSTTTLTITDALTATALSGYVVYTYTTRIGKPLLITSARIRDVNQLDRRVEVYAREDYLALPSKYTYGVVYLMYYQPKITTGDLFVYQVPNDCRYTLQVNYFKILEDFDAQTDDADFPSEWLLCIVYNLAMHIAPKMGKDQKLITDIAPMAQDLYERLREWSHDHTYVQISPYLRR